VQQIVTVGMTAKLQPFAQLAVQGQEDMAQIVRDDESRASKMPLKRGSLKSAWAPPDKADHALQCNTLALWITRRPIGGNRSPELLVTGQVG
jgi:hypothetical protein